MAAERWFIRSKRACERRRRVCRRVVLHNHPFAALRLTMVKENFGLIPKTAVGQVIMHVQHAERIHRPHEAGIDELISFSVVSQPSVEVEPTCSDDVMITPELYRRTLRAPDSGTELAAWKHLAGFLTQEPRVVFEQLAEVLVRACHADSAGATLEERRDSSGNLQWVSAAGQLAPRHRHRVSGHSARQYRHIHFRSGVEVVAVSVWHLHGIS